MKKVALLLCSIIFLSGCSYHIENHTNLAFPKKGDFFCPATNNYDGSYVLSEDIFDAGEKCNDYKSEFWQTTDPNAYNNCLQRKKIFLERFHLGNCAIIIKKTHNVKKSGCLFELATKYHKIVKFSCYGEDIPAVTRIIKAKYEIVPKMK